MIKTKRIRLVLVMFVLLTAVALNLFYVNNIAEAADIDTAEAQYVNQDDIQPDDIQPRLFTKLDLNISTGNGIVNGIVKNSFTLGFATVQVYVYLYSSVSYFDSIDNMTLESSNYISDLDIYQTISASGAINGVGRYWKAKSRYRIDSSSWAEMATLTFYIDKDGKIDT